MRIETEAYDADISMDGEDMVSFHFEMASGRTISGEVTVDELLAATNRLSHELIETFGQDIGTTSEDEFAGCKVFPNPVLV